MPIAEVIVMFTASQIRANARKTMQGQYWTIVLALLIFSAFSALTATSGLNFQIGDIKVELIPKQITDVTSSMSGIYTILVLAPLNMGLCALILGISRVNEGKVGDIFSKGFTSNYGNVILAQLLMSVLIFLWSLLLIVPGIIKAYAYSMTPYILADNPNMKAYEAMKYSEKIMMGHKARLFTLMLSFIGWFILSALTCGILYVFYVGPYYKTAMAEFYRSIVESGEHIGNAFSEAPYQNM